MKRVSSAATTTKTSLPVLPTTPRKHTTPATAEAGTLNSYNQGNSNLSSRFQRGHNFYPKKNKKTVCQKIKW